MCVGLCCIGLICNDLVVQLLLSMVQFLVPALHSFVIAPGMPSTMTGFVGECVGVFGGGGAAVLHPTRVEQR